MIDEGMDTKYHLEINVHKSFRLQTEKEQNRNRCLAKVNQIKLRLPVQEHITIQPFVHHK